MCKASGRIVSCLQREKITDFIAVQLLRHRALTPEKAVGALDWLGVAFVDVDDQDGANWLHDNANWRVAVARDVLHACAQRVAIGDANNPAVVSDAE